MMEGTTEDAECVSERTQPKPCSVHLITIGPSFGPCCKSVGGPGPRRARLSPDSSGQCAADRVHDFLSADVHTDYGAVWHGLAQRRLRAWDRL